MERSYNWKDIVCLCVDVVLRIGFGAMFLYSALGKIQDPRMFQTMVDNYRMLPACMTALFAVVLPMAELFIGVMFLFTKWTREAAFATVVMFTMFIVALAQAQIRGLDISCGCFSESNDKENHAVMYSLVRDVLLSVPAIWLLIKGQQRFIVDLTRIWHIVQR